MLRKYYTVQNIEAWNAAQKKGYLDGNMDYIYENFLEAYSWMMNQMKKRLSSYEGEYPVWLWDKRPDLRRGGLLNPKEQGVLLEVYIPEERVLLSDFNLWHCVLNNAPVADNEEEWELFEQGLALITKEQSWERIFDINHTTGIKKISKQILQGVTGRIYSNEIKQIKKFIARNINI